MIISRFAPAPTGLLHLGHIVNALHVWGITRAVGGRVLLRIEDHDRQRSRPEYERAILDDLDWLGFVPDEPSTDDFRVGACVGRQRDREAHYEAALARLQAADLVYACDCTRRDLREAMDAGPADGSPDGELRYSGRCSNRQLEWRGGRGLRVRLAPSVEHFDDLRHGPTDQRPSEQCGDMLVKDRDGNWTYQFAVTVDDLDQGVTLVIRGDDLLPSTGRQIQLARLLGRTVPPVYLHHALVMKSATQKLSKADRDTSIRDMRDAGRSVEDVIGLAAHGARLAESDRPMTCAEAEARVAERFAVAIARLRARAFSRSV
ncbi:MAG: glutamate--tRNA ligase family protein [Vicinamibacterales bacterium]